LTPFGATLRFFDATNEAKQLLDVEKNNQWRNGLHSIMDLFETENSVIFVSGEEDKGKPSETVNRGEESGQWNVKV